ncbi:MAG: tRNA preQ1(34) S-adenosylmethionine ribosyltransferase-isomerase QueA [Alphaproteobacteria bacterium]
MKVDQFDFDLPRTRIAAHPARPRDAARMLVVGARLDDRRVRDLPALLRPDDLVVVNDTRVMPARLEGRIGAGTVEVTLDRELEPGLWSALARPAKRFRPGERVRFAEDFAAEVAERREGGEVTLRFAETGTALLGRLARHGAVPLPPYIPRPAGPEPGDATDYQTVFARHAGAVAAPTAGLHFTDDLIARLAARAIGWTSVTLHVGAGTFLPVRVEETRDHRMHPEWGHVGPDAVQAVARARAAGGRVVAVGSTSLRLLETAADGTGRVQPFEGLVDLFITPGFRFRVADLMLTNFHLPRSTLIMLVAAFAGLDRVKAAYAHAIAEGYRFYSYGDACLLERNVP